MITSKYDDSDVEMLVLLGEIGGTEEYDIIKAKKAGLLTKLGSEF